MESKKVKKLGDVILGKDNAMASTFAPVTQLNSW